MIGNCELQLISKDWGEANLNPMVRAYGLKKDRKAKCKSCVHFVNGSCKFVCPLAVHSGEYRACTRYVSKKRHKRKDLI